MLIFTQCETIRGLPVRYQQCHCLAALPTKMSVFKVACRASIQWFPINPDFAPKKVSSYNKNSESLCCKTNLWVCLFELWWWSNTDNNYSSSSKCSSAAQIYIWTTFLWFKTFFITLVTYSVDVDDIFTNCRSTFVIKLGNIVQSWTAAGSKMPQKI